MRLHVLSQTQDEIFCTFLICFWNVARKWRNLCPVYISFGGQHENRRTRTAWKHLPGALWTNYYGPM